MRLFHFSDDPSIVEFTPHVPATNPTHPAAVWAIDEWHQAAYWFPRDCPRVTVWCADGGDAEQFGSEFETTATRVHAIEATWLGTVGTALLYRYELPTAPFVRWEEADGQWIAHEPVRPRRVEPFDRLVARHQQAGIELRPVASLWPLRDRVVASGWPFSIIRMQRAAPRP